MSEPEQNRPARNMADIARMFLDGARAASHGESPKRVAPGQRTVETRIAQPTPPASHGSSWEMPAVMLGIGGGANSWRLLSNMAAGLAKEHATTVCLLGMRDGQFLIEVAGSESAADLPRVTPTAGSADLQVARMLFTLRDSIGHWMIAAPDAGSAAFPKVASTVAQWLLACAANNEGVVAGYQQVKRALSRAKPETSPRCYMVSDDYAEAALIHGRLRTATSEFLQQELPLAGTGNSDELCRRVGEISVSDKVCDLEMLWSAVLDELCGGAAVDEETEAGELSEASSVAEELDIETALERVSAATEAVTVRSRQAYATFDQLAHVLDPEERAALSADFNDADDMENDIPAPATLPPEPITRPVMKDIRQQVTPPTTGEFASFDREPTPVAADQGHGVTLRAFDMLDSKETDRAAQWQAVERSVRDLVVDSTLLEARPPMSWATDCCMAIDANGGLHVWTLYKDGVSWFALREWAAEHRNLLALTRRDLVLNREGEVTVHVVLPLESAVDAARSAPDVKSLLRTPSKNVFVYRLRVVQWNGRRGMVVVPIA